MLVTFSPLLGYLGCAFFCPVEGRVFSKVVGVGLRTLSLLPKPKLILAPDLSTSAIDTIGQSSEDERYTNQ